jgi:hypothetical protein
MSLILNLGDSKLNHRKTSCSSYYLTQHLLEFMYSFSLKLSQIDFSELGDYAASHDLQACARSSAG